MPCFVFHRVNEVVMDDQVRMAFQVARVTADFQVFQDQRESEGPPVAELVEDCQDQKEIQARQDPLAHLVRKVTLEDQDKMDCLALKVAKCVFYYNYIYLMALAC